MKISWKRRSHSECFLCADNQFRMSILERLEQMERRMLEMAARDSNHNQQQQHHHQHGSQLATPLPPPLPEDHEQVRMATNRNPGWTQNLISPI